MRRTTPSLTGIHRRFIGGKCASAAIYETILTHFCEYRQTFATPLFRLDVVDGNISLRTTLNRREEIPGEGHIFTFPSEDEVDTLTSVQIAGPLYRADYLPRNNEVSFYY